MMLDPNDRQRELLRKRARVIARMQVADDRAGLRLEKLLHPFHRRGERIYGSEIRQIADIRGGINKLVLCERECVLELSADCQELTF